MEFCCGNLGWSPDRFWGATFWEISCAYVGKLASVGGLQDMVTEDDHKSFDAIIKRQEELEAEDPGGHKRRAAYKGPIKVGGT